MDLKAIRKNANYTQMELAAVCGCNRSTIGKIETGDLTPSVRLAKKIGNTLNFDWTLFYQEERNEEDNTGNDGGGPGDSYSNS